MSTETTPPAIQVNMDVPPPQTPIYLEAAAKRRRLSQQPVRRIEFRELTDEELNQSISDILAAKHGTILNMMCQMNRGK